MMLSVKHRMMLRRRSGAVSLIAKMLSDYWYALSTRVVPEAARASLARMGERYDAVRRGS